MSAGGRYTEVMSRVSCPDCIRSGRRESPVMYYVSDEPGLSMLQARCTNRRDCGWVETRAADAGIAARQALLKSRRRARAFMLFIIGETIALAATIVAASVAYAMR
jgi:hypothetical protein